MLVAISIASFLLLHALPGDPTAALLGQQATEENMASVRHEWGLDRPLPIQYVDFVGSAAQGDFGKSYFTNQEVSTELKQKIPATIELAVAAMLLATVMGISLGILASVKPRSVWDFLCLSIALVGVSMPIFWLGFLLIQFFAGDMGVVPFGGRFNEAGWKGFSPETGFYIYEALVTYRSPELTLELLHHLLLPALVLATVPMALIARMTRASMLEVLDQDYIRTARAKGVGAVVVVVRHAMRNALIPVVTSIGTQFGYLLGGAVLTETIFNWPGMGRYVVDAVVRLDGKPLQASVLIIATFFVLVNLTTDISYSLIDPRLRHKGRK